MQLHFEIILLQSWPKIGPKLEDLILVANIGPILVLYMLHNIFEFDFLDKIIN